MSDRVEAPGLQSERTALAWRRTALSMGVGALAAARVFPNVFGIWALVPAAVAVVIAGIVFVAAHRRYRSDHAAINGTEPRIALSGGRLPAITAAAALVFGLIAAVVLLVR